jgi:hypothetical protein
MVDTLFVVPLMSASISFSVGTNGIGEAVSYLGGVHSILKSLAYDVYVKTASCYRAGHHDLRWAMNSLTCSGSSMLTLFFSIMLSILALVSMVSSLSPIFLLYSRSSTSLPLWV